MEDDRLPIRKKYDIINLIALIPVLLGAVPFLFCKKLEGFFLVYFIVYISFDFLFMIYMWIGYYVVRKAEIKAFSKKFSVENMDKSVNFKFKKKDFIFHVNGIDIELQNDRIKNLKDDEEYLYKDLKIYATYQCFFAGEIYKIFINFQSENQTFSLKLNSALYSILKYYKINVEDLDIVLNNCEKNLKTFFKSKKLRKEAVDRQVEKNFNEDIKPILALYGDKATVSNFNIKIRYHDHFIINYNYTESNIYINEKLYCFVEEQDLLEFLTEINNDEYYIVEYENKRLTATPYFKFLSKKKANIDKVKKTDNVSRIFDINGLIYSKKQAK